MRRRRWMILAASALLATVLASAHAAQAGGHPDRPSRVLIIMLDQARPDTIQRYDMENVQELMRKGISFPNALVGHMAARDGREPQRDHERPVPEAHGLVERGPS
jgi:hypothetical protein